MPQLGLHNFHVRPGIHRQAGRHVPKPVRRDAFKRPRHRPAILAASVSALDLAIIRCTAPSNHVLCPGECMGVPLRDCQMSSSLPRCAATSSTWSMTAFGTATERRLWFFSVVLKCHRFSLSRFTALRRTWIRLLVEPRSLSRRAASSPQRSPDVPSSIKISTWREHSSARSCSCCIVKYTCTVLALRGGRTPRATFFSPLVLDCNIKNLTQHTVTVAHPRR